MGTANKPLVGVVMGSSSDWDVMQHAVAILKEFGIAHEAQVLSAHRMPDQMFDYAKAARDRGLRAIIAGAGGAAHLPGMIASQTIVPVLGVPVPSKYLRGECGRALESKFTPDLRFLADTSYDAALKMNDLFNDP
jgi:5-(carboxyamino)imidazole ribonucleotide mutase